MGRPRGSKNIKAVEKEVDVMPAVKPDPVSVAMAVPGSIFAEKSGGDVRTSMGETRTQFSPVDGRVLAGVGPNGFRLDPNLYITPDPSKAYKFCTLDSRRTGLNRSRGFTQTTVGGKDIVVGNMQLCQRPIELKIAEDAAKAEFIRARSGKARAATVAKENPGIFGSESVDVK